MAIVLPSQLKELLEQDHRLNGSIHSVLSLVVPWFADNKLVFFPEYTDHGPKHITEVLGTAEALVSSPAWGILSPEDAATLVLAIILHDSAMHLSEDGFVTLIATTDPGNVSLNDRPWRDLWREFLTEARRFDARKLNALFGDTDPIKEPPLDSLKMTKKDHLLIGEFLRRHHARLANEIAITGIPGSRGKRVSLGDIPESVKQLAGIAARSHGLDLRVCVDYLNSKTKWGARRTSGIHITYVMTLVRIADYFQIHRDRAPQGLLKIRSLNSPVSRGEWNTHDAIVDIHQETDDPEALWVEAAPQDVKIYLKIRDLVKDIQRELDDCWAVLGEVYGPKNKLRDLGLTIRRIRSNLDDTEAFAKTVSYIPCRAALAAVGADLLSLLIKPLYGDYPAIGIRELLQNSVDACRELKDYLEQHPDLSRPEFEDQDSDVVISLKEENDGSKWVTVSDKGIGMTVDTLVNYFLKAGASFRNSEAWRRQHENEQTRSRVLRSGRFGVGVLASFLLGEEIHISTRHITAPATEGISFSCKLLDEAVELRRVTRPIGTTIAVQISDRIFAALLRATHQSKEQSVPRRVVHEHDSWDWYFLKEPSIARVTPAGELAHECYLPSPSAPLPAEWRLTEHPDFLAIHWTYLADAPELVCNGILIAYLTDYADCGPDTILRNSEFDQPKLSVFDPHGRLPLNLQRTYLQTCPFEDSLLRDISRDFIAYLLVNAPTEHPLLSRDNAAYDSFRYPGLRIYQDWYWCAPRGISLLIPSHLKTLDISRLHRISPTNYGALRKLIGSGSLLSLIPCSTDPVRGFLSFINRSALFWLEVVTSETRGCSLGQRLLATLDEVETIRSEDDRHPRDYIESVLSPKWVLLERGYCLPASSEEEMIYSASEDKLFPIATTFVDHLFDHTEASPVDPDRSPLVDSWQEYIQKAYIPYNLEERKEAFKHAYKELAPYIEAWQHLKGK